MTFSAKAAWFYRPVVPQSANEPGAVLQKPRLGSRRPEWVKKAVPLFLLFVIFQCFRGDFSIASDIPVGRLINPQGAVSVLASDKAGWEEALNGRDLFAGDSVRTGPDSRVAILCVDETQLKLNQNTVVVLKSSAPSARLGGAVPAAQKETGASLYEVWAGEVWLRNKNEKTRFEVRTPAVTAAIRGTEFNLKVAQGGATDLVLLEGRLTLANAQGQIDLDPGEEGLAEVGRAPVKRVVLQPKDAVQWSLYYPGVFSCRDIPLGARLETTGLKPEASSAGVSPQLSNAVAFYDRGDLGSSERSAEEVLALDPKNEPALLVLGWISLQRQDPRKARVYFEKILRAQPGSTTGGPGTRSVELAVSGLVLALYRTGNAVGAYKLMIEELRKGPAPSSLTLVISGYFSMLAGKIDEAKALLSDSRVRGRESAIAHALLGQIYLIQNSKEQAAAEAAAALRENGESPMALMTEALVKISYFDLPEARRLLEQSVAADPNFLDAYVYLARLWLGADYLDRAREIISRALAISQTDSEVLSLAGFIRLGYRDYDKALKLFTEAVKYNPGFGEPHIGLSNIAFSKRNFTLGLTEMLTATLLEPRVSLYQSSLGKALYQTRSFDKALEVYDYAKSLDPNDPTPYLYKGIALTDLYRPGDAIQEINKSIELNDNTAVFRSRLMLDRDLAVRNTNLATAFNQLGMAEWAYSKAVTAIKSDPFSASARLLLGSTYQATNQRLGASESEILQYILLAPANENTFTQSASGNYVDYTQMFEMPYARFIAESGAGTWADHRSLYQDQIVDVLGGLPGLAVNALGNYQYNPGFRLDNNDQESLSWLIDAKFDPTIKDSFYGNYSYLHPRYGDISNQDDYSYRSDPNLKIVSPVNSSEGGYVHRFSPSAVFIGYFHWDHDSSLYTDYFNPFITKPFPYIYTLNQYINSTLDAKNIQLQQQLKIGDHTFIAGFEYLTGFLNYHGIASYVYWIPPLYYIHTFNDQYNTPNSDTSIYFRDYWRICPQLLAELGVSGELVTSSRYAVNNSISSSTVNPMVGLDYAIDKSNTLRLAYQGYVVGHPYSSAVIAPAEVAGFPSQLNADDGSKVKELGFAWESQWNSKTFTVLRLQAYRVDDPQYSPQLYVINDRTDRLEGTFVVNRLLTSSLGLSAGITGKLLSLDDPFLNLSGNFNEIDATVGFSYMHPSGWFASISDTLVNQGLGGLSDKSIAQRQAEFGNPFSLVNIAIGKYFAGKRGFASLELDNAFNQHFFYQIEPDALWSFSPDREIIFRVGLFF
jgi:tetratricopeptide (TPR) repeat protein